MNVNINRYTTSVVEFLTVYKDLNTPNFNFQTMIDKYGLGFFSNWLILAVQFNDMEKIKYLVETCKVNLNNEGSTYFSGNDPHLALNLAVTNNNFQLVKYLLEKGADVNGMCDSFTPIYIACRTGCLKIVHILVKKGANIEFSDVDNYTCLMRACLGKHYKAVEFLLLKHAEKNRTTTSGDTALHLSVGDLKMVKLLLKHGADENVLNHENCSPLLLASLKCHRDVVEYLTSLPTCDRKEKVKAFELLGAQFIHKKDDLIQAREVWKLVEGQAKIISKYKVVEDLGRFQKIETLTDDEMYIRALIVQEWLVKHHEDSLKLIVKLGNTFAKQKKFDLCLDIFKYAFRVSRTVMCEVLPSFNDCLYLMKDEKILCNRSEDLLEALTIVVEKNIKENCLKMVPAVLGFIYVLMLIMKDNLKFKGLVSQLIKLPIPCGDHTEFLHYGSISCLAKASWLHYACKYHIWINYIVIDSLALVSFLISVGADVNEFDYSRKYKPLNYARTPSICKKLIECGANFDVYDPKQKC